MRKRALWERLARARSLTPPKGVHTVAAWELGRAAALAAVAEDGNGDRASDLAPPRESPCRAFWQKGRDDAVRVLEPWR